MLAAAMLAAAPAFACDSALEASVAAAPDDIGVREQLARSCQRAGRPAEALTHYQALLAKNPDNVDWLLGAAQAHTALGRPVEALPLLERARGMAPGYEDLWRAEIAALEAVGDLARAEALSAEATRKFPRARWPAERRQAMAERRLLERGTRLSIDASYEDLSDGLDPWQGASVGVDHGLGGARHLLAGLHVEERFNRRDEQLQLGFADRAGKHWSFAASGDLTRDAEILPEWSLVLDAGRALPGERGLGLRARHASFTTADVDSVAAVIEQYVNAFTVGYTLNATRTSGIGDVSLGHALRVARGYGRDSQAALALGFGEEAEIVGPGVVQVTDVRSLTLYGVHWRSAAWGITWEAGWVEQGDLYDRVRVRLGLEHRF